jgi:oxygen-independent coproporphyrinogen-3 oxidase
MSGIYIHIPFCKQACYYCDFHFSTSLKKKEDMLEAIAKELVLRKPEISSQVTTIYFGGGTPSLLSEKEINQLVELIARHYDVADEPEITLEANPDDLTQEKIEALAQSRVNRLSIGVQSFFDQDLEYMNRAHNADEARKSMEQAIKHFNNISIDLIYGLPHLSEETWRKNLAYAFELGVQHISSYALTVEPKTALDHFIKSGKYQAPVDALTEKHFKILQEETEKHGFIQYEISNFGREGFFSKHNTSYWKGVNYVGIGPSAHSYDGLHRSWNIANNTKYISAIQRNVLPLEKELLSPEDSINEAIMTGLRTIWGVSLEEISNRHGEKFKEEILFQAEKYLEKGILYREQEHLFLRPESYFLADGISADLFLLKV